MIWHGIRLVYYTEDYFEHISDEFGNRGKKATRYFFLDYETSMVIHKVRGVLFMIIGVIFLVLVVIRICIWLFPSLAETLPYF